MKTFRLHVLFLFFVVSAVVLVGRLFSLQVHDYGMFAAFARGQQQVTAEIPSERGKIYGHDQNGRVELATNRDWQTVYVIPKDVTDLEKTWLTLRDILGLDDEASMELKERLGRTDDPYEPVEEKLNEEEAQRIREAALPGVHLRTDRGRFYPQGTRGSHVVGFVGYVDSGEARGTYGIEAFFETTLRGVAGTLRGERDGQGTILEAFSLGNVPPQSGADIVLTIDPNIQYQAEKALHTTVESWQATGGSVIVMDPKTGAIRALANEPTFDPNEYGKVNDISVFTNAAVAELYEPGSAFKPITMAAAIDSGAVTPETTFNNTGSIAFGGYTISNTLQQYNGMRTMVDVLRYSLNTGAVFAQQATGQDAFRSYVEAFGFGEPTGISLPGEASGSLKNLSSGRPINFATASFGQGISVTPLQLANAIAVIANGGMLMRPYIVEETISPSGEQQTTQPETVRRVLQQRTATRLAAMMTRVVEDGSGVRAKMPGYTIAGKTGTAEIPNIGSSGYGSLNIHTFVGFFPAFDPRYVILTKVDRPQGVRYAESTAVPMFRQLAEYLITYAAIPPDRPVENKK